MNELDKEITGELRLIEAAIIAIGQKQHELILKLKKYCEKRANEQDST